MSNISFVREKEIPQSPPPITESNAIRWVRQNLFSGWLNSLLTILSVYFIYVCLRDFIPWAYGGIWTANSIRECLDINPDVACFSVIGARWRQLLFGFYPTEEYWRPILTFVLLFISIAPVLIPRFARFFWFSLIYPGIAVWLLWGGAIWPVFSIYLAISLTGLVFFLAKNKFKLSSGFSFTAAILFFFLYFIFIAGPFIALFKYILPINLVLIESLQFGGFLLSMIVGFSGIAASFPIGILLALGRQSDLPLVKMICVGFIEFIRGVPLITLLFVASVLLNYFLPPGTSFDIIIRVIIMVTIFSAAYMAEVIRGGLAALPVGQHEASAALGLSYWQSQRLIIMPQALKISIPGIVNTFIGLFKDTTLVSIISLLDPVGLASLIRADQKWNGIYWELYVAIGLMFFICCFGMSQYSQYLERKLKTDNS
mgnify:FL=1